MKRPSPNYDLRQVDSLELWVYTLLICFFISKKAIFVPFTRFGAENVFNNPVFGTGEIDLRNVLYIGDQLQVLFDDTRWSPNFFDSRGNFFISLWGFGGF